MALQIIGSIRDGLRTFEGILPEDHGINPKRIQSFIEAGLLEEVEIVVKRRPKPKPTIARHGKWDLDPEGLVGLNLGRLNALIAERGGTSQSTVEEAVKFLTKDFNPAAKAAKAKVVKRVVVWEDEENETGPELGEPLPENLPVDEMPDDSPEGDEPAAPPVPTSEHKVVLPTMNFVPPLAGPSEK